MCSDVSGSASMSTPLSDQSDESLFERVQNGDSDAFSVLYDRYDRRVYAYCLRMTGQVTLAEDTYQDVFVKVYEKRDSFGGGSFARWLFTIARTTSLNAIRDRKYNEDITEPKFEPLLNTSGGMKTDWFLKEALEKAVADLPDEFRECLVLRQYSGYSYQEISEMLGISLSLAKVRVFRAVRLLQKTLAPYIEDRHDE